MAGAWLTQVVGAAVGLPSVEDLTRPEHDLAPAGSVTVIVPAKNEERDIGECLRSLMGQDYPVEIIAVNDRSTDGTGAVMRSLAGPGLRCVTIGELPAGWLGKTHAMAVAAEGLTSDWVLFTDADIFFRADALRRAVAYAEATGADHLVVGPTTIIRRWDEGAILALFSVFGLFAARPWKVADPKARDAIGIGGFNLLRTAAYRELGGFGAVRMDVVEDLALGRRVKEFGLRQRFAYGVGLVRVHWASGARGLIGVMTKNVFAATNYHVSLILLGCLWLCGFYVAPFVLVWWPRFMWPCLVVIGSMGVGYRLLGRLTGLGWWNFLLAPFAAGVFVFVLLRSTVVTLWDGGVTWRGTFYELGELRRMASPLVGKRRG